MTAVNFTVDMDVECDAQIEVEVPACPVCGDPACAFIRGFQRCDFRGEVEVTIYYDSGRWTCPECGTEHQIEGMADYGEPDPDAGREP